jgi:hypothetical protein
VPTTTLVADVYVSKAEALSALSETLGIPVRTTDPSNAVLDLDGGVLLTIDIPKFGEDLPLTIDLTADDAAALAEAALNLIDKASNALGWTLNAVTADG